MHKHLKYISITILSFIIFETNISAQRTKPKKERKISGSIVKRSSLKQNANTQPATQEQTTPTETEPQPENTQDTEYLKLEIERLTAQNNQIRNSITEKQTKFDSVKDKINNIRESLENLELKQNKSKSTCKQLNVKKMEEVQGWLIATVAASGVGVAANTTATVTSFLQKDEKQLNKQNQRAEAKLEHYKTTQEDKYESELEQYKTAQEDKYKSELDKLTTDTTLKLNDYAEMRQKTTDDEEKNLIESAEKELNTYYEDKQNILEQNKIDNIANKLTEISDKKAKLDDLTAKTTSLEKQQKTNKVLNTVSTISGIVGTVASGTATITTSVATGLITNIANQVKNCKGTF